MRRLGIIQQVPVDVVLQDEARGVEPVVEDLAAHDVAADAPAVGVALVAEPVVAEDLDVEVVGLEGGVVDVELWALEEEEGVVVDELLAEVEAEEGGDDFVLVVGGVDELGRVSG
jgi:hypothetical protein